MNPKNPFEDPEYPIDDHVRGKDVKPPEKKIEKKAVPKPEQSGLDFLMGKTGDYYVIRNGVEHNNSIYTVDVAASLLAGGAKKYLPDWHRWLKSDENKHKYTLASAPFYYSIFRTLYKNRETLQHQPLIGHARNNLQSVLSSQIYTFSDVVYEKKVLPDVVRHRDGGRETIFHENMHGESGYVEDLKDSKEVCKALLCSDDVQEVIDVCRWISGFHPNLVRLSEDKSNVKGVKPILLGGCSDGISERFHIDTFFGADFPAYALGVRIHKQGEEKVEKSQDNIFP